MKVFIACEESQEVCKAFRAKGHEAYSCDIAPCSGGHPEWHIQDDVLNHLDEGWDLMVAHPPCTYLCNSGVCWFCRDVSRWTKMAAAGLFFKHLANAPIPKIAIENPIPHGYAVGIIGKYDQIIQPYQFGHPERKATCLWLKNLPKLKPTNVVKLPDDKRKAQRLHYLPPSPDRARIRSRTFKGIAEAMANQWGTINT